MGLLKKKNESIIYLDNAATSWPKPDSMLEAMTEYQRRVGANPGRSGPYRKFTELVVDGYSRYPGEENGAVPELRRGRMAGITPEMVLDKVAVARGCG